ncbi:hypothetical protein WA158_004849 [Blastocystis sp. Blastoise]
MDDSDIIEPISKCCVGVQSFSANMNEIEVSQNANELSVEVLSQENNQFVNYTSILETSLSKYYPCLQKDQIIQIPWGSILYEMKIIDIKPEMASTIDTDINFNITYKYTNETVLPITSLSFDSIVHHYSFSDSSLYYLYINHKDINNKYQLKDNEFFYIQFTIDKGNSYMYINHNDNSDNISQFPRLFNHEYLLGDFNGGEYVLPKDTNQLFTLITVEKLSSIETQTLISVQLNVKTISKTMPILTSSSSEYICSNCWKSIPINKRTMHELSCYRLNKRCLECNQVLSPREFSSHHHCTICDRVYTCNEQNHVNSMHKPIKCQCNISIPLYLLTNHLKECSERVITCRFCGEEHKYMKPNRYEDILEGYSEHESICANKTYLCSLCHQYIKVKYNNIHINVYHKDKEYILQDKQWMCPQCTAINSDLYTVCQFCRYVLSPSLPSYKYTISSPYINVNTTNNNTQSTYICEYCDEINNIQFDNCRRCKKNRFIEEDSCKNHVCPNKVQFNTKTCFPIGCLCTNCSLILLPELSKYSSINMNTSAFDLQRKKLYITLYSTQLLKGCGDISCKNIFCKTYMMSNLSKYPSILQTIPAFSCDDIITYHFPLEKQEILKVALRLVDIALKQGDYFICMKNIYHYE